MAGGRGLAVDSSDVVNVAARRLTGVVFGQHRQKQSGQLANVKQVGQYQSGGVPAGAFEELRLLSTQQSPEYGACQ